MRLLLTTFTGIDIDHVNHLGFTALMKAAIQGHIDCLGLLLSSGADDTICDPTNKMCAKGISIDCIIQDPGYSHAYTYSRLGSVLQST